ncbi:Scr1 family TA system antitoxin-like transcriptional regulator [Streptosporangium amethystogenes subsp. fukuiense]|uniref:Scr1 family TA system antitoxin-like transcriptional regulator n=1 Tax=Streptosporangium amethystogenes subsp. fukuiense TaxID=698418 RepID=A0ABW2SQG8_9ACTN
MEPDRLAVRVVAVTLRTYEPLMVPGLLQTEAYAYALLGDDEASRPAWGVRAF